MEVSAPEPVVVEPKVALIVLHKCVGCRQEIRDVRFTCTHSDCEDFHLCGECFMMHVELGKHKKDHPYDLTNEAAHTLFDNCEGWLCVDEQRLLEAMERYGYGNWESVATMVPGKTPQEIKAHYDEYYADGNIGAATWAEAEEEPSVIEDEIGLPDPSLDLPEAYKIDELTAFDFAEMGYMPKRDDFYKEYDNSAEEEISQIVFVEGEDELDREMKMALIDGYRRRLMERNRRKKIAREHGLLFSFLKGEGMHPSLDGVDLNSREGRLRADILDQIKEFIQFFTRDELDTLVNGILKQMELKARIRELMRARRNGLTRLDELEHFETARKIRARHLHQRGQPLGSDLCGPESAEEFSQDGFSGDLEDEEGKGNSELSATRSDVSGCSGTNGPTTTTGITDSTTVTDSSTTAAASTATTTTADGESTAGDSTTPTVGDAAVISTEGGAAETTTATESTASAEADGADVLLSSEKEDNHGDTAATANASRKPRKRISVISRDRKGYRNRVKVRTPVPKTKTQVKHSTGAGSSEPGSK